MASKKKTEIGNPGASSKGGTGVSIVKSKRKLRKEKFQKLKEEYGTPSKLLTTDGEWYKTNKDGEVISRTIPVNINQDLTRKSFTDIVLKIESTAEELNNKWEGKNPIIWTTIEAYEYARNMVGSKPLESPDKENDLPRSINGTISVPLDQLNETVSGRLRKYFNNGGHTYITYVLVHVRSGES